MCVSDDSHALFVDQKNLYIGCFRQNQYLFKNKLETKCITECMQNNFYSNSFVHMCLSCFDELDGGMCFNSAIN